MGGMAFPSCAMAVAGGVTKRDRLSWFGLTRFRTTVRVSKQEQVMFERAAWAVVKVRATPGNPASV